MPKLADLIQRATRGEPAPLGFTASRGKQAPTIVLVAIVGQRWKQGVADAKDAAAILLAGHPDDSDLREAVAAAEGRPCGLLAPDAAGIAKVKDTGLDFAALPLDAPAAALQHDDVAVLLRVPNGLSDVQLRAMDGLPVDALYVEHHGGARTIADHLELRRLSGLARKALLLPAPAGAAQDELLALREAGVALLAVDMGRGGAEELRRLREAIDALPRPKRRRGERAEVTVPSAGRASREEEDDEDDD